MKIISRVRGRPLQILHAKWSSLRHQLGHSASTQMQIAPEYEEEFENAGFPLGTFDDVSSLPQWIRITVECHVVCSGNLSNQRRDGTGSSPYVRDAMVCHTKGCVLALRIAHRDAHDMDFLQAGLHIIVKYGRITGSAGIYADTTELSQVEATGKEKSVALPDLATMQPTLGKTSSLSTTGDAADKELQAQRTQV